MARTLEAERKQLAEMEAAILRRANLSLAILGMAFVRHGSGRFLWLGPRPEKRVRNRQRR